MIDIHANPRTAPLDALFLYSVNPVQLASIEIARKKYTTAPINATISQSVNPIKAVVGM